MPPPLADQAEVFAGEMTRLLAATISDNVEMQVVAVESSDEPTRYVIGNRIGGEAQHPVEQMRGEHIPIENCPNLALRTSWVFVPSTSGEWIKVQWSQFGLFVKHKSDWVPFVRLEVDPTKDEWASAHYNITAESSLLGYIWGRTDNPNRRLQSLHFPVGGFRFRPCLEDFLEFLIDERLIPAREGWKEALQPTRDSYRKKQLEAMIAKHPDVAERVLERLRK